MVTRGLLIAFLFGCTTTVSMAIAAPPKVSHFGVPERYEQPYGFTIKGHVGLVSSRIELANYVKDESYAKACRLAIKLSEAFIAGGSEYEKPELANRRYYLAYAFQAANDAESSDLLKEVQLHTPPSLPEWRNYAGEYATLYNKTHKPRISNLYGNVIIDMMATVGDEMALPRKFYDLVGDLVFVGEAQRTREPVAAVQSYFRRGLKQLRSSPLLRGESSQRFTYHEGIARVLATYGYHDLATSEYLLAFRESAAARVQIADVVWADSGTVVIAGPWDGLGMAMLGVNRSTSAPSRERYQGYQEELRKRTAAAKLLAAEDSPGAYAATFRCFGYEKQRLPPQDFIGLYLYGRLLELRGLEAEALTLYEASLAIHPTYLSVLERRAYLLRKFADAPLPPERLPEIPNTSEEAIRAEVEKRLSETMYYDSPDGDTFVEKRKVSDSGTTITVVLERIHDAIKKPEFRTAAQVENQRAAALELHELQIREDVLKNLEEQLQETQAAIEAVKADRAKRKAEAVRLAQEAAQRRDAVLFDLGETLFTRPEYALIGREFGEALNTWRKSK